MRADTKDRELLFIRHCESYGNLDFAENAPVYHPDDPPLTPLGLRQARALSSRFEKGDLDRVYCSSLIRTVQTVYPTAEKLGMSFDLLPQLMEYGTGIDMTDRDRLREHYPLAVIRFPEGGGYGGESEAEARKRAESAVDLILSETKPGERVAVVTHGSIMGFFIRYLLGITQPEPFRWIFDNCGVTDIILKAEGSGEKPRLACANDRAHLFGLSERGT